MAEDFILSPENLTDLVLADYSSILGREPAASEVTFWLNLVNGSTDPATVLNEGFLGSAETYFDRTTGVP